MTGSGGAHARLRFSEELNLRIMEAMPGGIVHVLVDGSIVTANAEALRILGLSYDAITDRYTTDFDTETIWEDGSHCAQEDYPVTRALVTGEPQPPATIGVRRPDGGVSWAVFTAVPVKDPDSKQTTGAVVTFLDITDRKHTEEKLRISDRMASLGMLAAGVAHEINNPLAYAMVSLRAALEQLEGDPAEVELLDIGRHVSHAEEGLERIRRVVRDLGQFSRGDDQAAPVSLHDVLDAAIRMASHELRYRARLVRDYRDVPPVVASPSRLGQVFVNLFVNAVQAIAIGDVDGNEIRVATRTDDHGWATVEIADTGPGIPEPLLARVFEPFFSTKPAGVGTGLGLYICKNSVHAMGGELTARNRRDRGALLSVRLPPAPRRAPPAEVASTRAPPLDASPRRVLVVDDEPRIRGVLEHVLTGHDVTVACSGREAADALASAEFDVVLCDLIMPEMSGMELYQRVCAARPALAARFVFMTGGAFTDQAREFLRDVQNPVLEKPFDVQVLLSLVTRGIG